MTTPGVDGLVRAVLHEGLLLYPYRESATKNRQGFTFGSVLPRDYCRARDTGDRWRIAAEVLVRGKSQSRVGVEAHYLLPASPDRDRRWPLGPVSLGSLAGAQHETTIPAGSVDATLAIAAERRDHALYALRAEIRNTTALRDPDVDREAALARGVSSALAVITVEGGELVSAIDPPEELAGPSSRLERGGWWPVLVGPPDSTDRMLVAPIILPDHPALAPESPGDLYDGTEIDELLVLRILTLSAEETEAMRRDPRARPLLERCENMDPEALAAMHGRLRKEQGPPEAVRVTAAGGEATTVRTGDGVRLRPRRRRGDVIDLSLAGREATIVAIEQEIEGGLFVAVTIDDDPGSDLGAAGFHGHRFFFRPDEVEAR